MDPAKKISFGFSKINKKVNLNVNKVVSEKPNNGVELIKCLEGQEIKLVQEKQERAALVIPLKENQKTSTALASLMKRRAVLLGEDEPPETNNAKTDEVVISNEPEDIEKRAAKELLAELHANSTSLNSESLVLPVVHPNDLPLEGAKESSMDDYDNIPIQDFGKAMLRGMGWVEPPKPAKGGPPVDEMPSVRPKGMGLGADKALKPKPLLVAPAANEVLEIKRNAYVRILGGKHKDLYGQIEGFDDHAGRVIVKMAIGGSKEAFNEFLCQPVARKEFTEYGKCINTKKFEEYKRKENEHGQIIWKEEDAEKPIDSKEKLKIVKKNTDGYEDTYHKSLDEDDRKMRQSKLKQENETEKRSKNVDRYEREEYRKNVSGRRENENRIKDKNKIQEISSDEEDYRKSSNSRYPKQEDKDEDRSRKESTSKDELGKSSRGYDRQSNYYKDEKYVDREDNRNKPSNSRDRIEEKYKHRESRNYDYRGNEHDEKYSKADVRDKYYDRDDSSRRNQRIDRDKNKDCDNRQSRQRKSSTSDEDSDSDKRERNRHKSSKDKKSKKKSKKSKKSKSSKYHDSTDTDSTSSSTSSDSEGARHKRHNKKTKKSKKQRERSRSRGRR
ncbi:uncharacterized protein LOC142220276 [Haematobia irritans]|uniref:uncharacterized protein LOC142220276 n=1 Tax=Haematobia irritans TaxID=7368 RepID=UPI003F4F97EE